MVFAHDGGAEQQPIGALFQPAIACGQRFDLAAVAMVSKAQVPAPGLHAASPSRMEIGFKTVTAAQLGKLDRNIESSGRINSPDFTALREALNQEQATKL